MLLNSLLVAYTGTIENADGDIESYLYPEVWPTYALEKLMRVFLWTAVALAVILIAVGLFVWFKKQGNFKRFLTTAVALAVGFSVTVIIAMLSLNIMELAEKGRIYDLILYPAAAAFGCAVLCVAAVYVASLFGAKAKKIALIIAGCVMGAALIALLVCLGVYYSRNVDGDGYFNSDVASVNQIVLYVSAVALIGVLLFFAFFFGRKDKKGFDSKSVAYAAVCIALSFALSYIKIFTLPQGGSVTIASLLPLMIYSYMFGVKKGVFAGFIYGILQAVQDPWIIHPAQFLLDYPIAFACIGVAGLFANVKKLEKLPQVQFALGAVVASTLRFVSHVLSGVFAFSAYAADASMMPWPYSLAYNSFVFVDIAIVLAAGVLAFSSKAFVREVRKFNAPAAPATVTAAGPAPSTEAPQEPDASSLEEPAAPASSDDLPQEPAEPLGPSSRQDGEK